MVEGALRASCFTLQREPERAIVTCLSAAERMSLSVISSEDGAMHLFSAMPAGLARIACAVLEVLTWMPAQPIGQSVLNRPGSTG